MDFRVGDPNIMEGESDEELLAELLALQEEAPKVNKQMTKKQSSAPKTRIVQLPKQPQRHQLPPPQVHIPNDISIDDPYDDGEEMDDLESEDLLNELNELVGPSGGEMAIKKRELQRTKGMMEEEVVKADEGPMQQHSRTVSPKRSKHFQMDGSDNDEIVETVPADPSPCVPPPLPPRSVPPSIPPRNSSIAAPPQQQHTEAIHPQPSPIEEKSKSGDVMPSKIEEKGTENENRGGISSLENRAKNLLLRRRKLYMERSVAAKQANDRATAIEAFETVKLFNQALDAIKEGAQLSEEDIEQVPPSPPPYKTVPTESTANNNNPNDVPSTSNLDKSSTKSDSDGKLKPTPISDDEIKSSMSDELKLVLTRRQQLKNEAFAAKQRGDLKTAKGFLASAHRMDQMVEAAKCGLPIDVQQIPELHSNAKLLPKLAVAMMGKNNEETLKKCQLLERELLKQIQFCEEIGTKFQSVNDSKNTLLYNGLLQQSKKDLQRVQLAALDQLELPNFKLLEMSLPAIELNASLADDKMELKIRKIDCLKLPEGWKPTDCSLYVFYKFPFPHGIQQTGRTATVKGTNSPEFSDVFLLDINRKTKQLLRICKRQPLKLEIYQKVGFLRRDKLFAHSDVSLQELEKCANISGVFPILEGRKKIGGSIHIEIRLSKHLGDGTTNSTINVLKRKWVKLDA